MGALEQLAKRDWQKQPYTEQEFRDLVLAKYQIAGIDPFYLFKSGQLPTEGDDLKTHLPDAVYGSVLDGIPGTKLKTDGTLHFPTKGSADILTELRATLRFMVNEIGQEGAGFHNDADHEYEVASHTLAGGALADSVVVTSTGTGYQTCTLWIIFLWNTAPAAAYTFEFHEAGGAAGDRYLTLPPEANGNKRCFLYLENSTADTDLQVTIGGGAGAEILQSIAYHTEV